MLILPRSAPVKTDFGISLLSLLAQPWMKLTLIPPKSAPVKTGFDMKVEQYHSKQPLKPYIYII